jgi:hypothetical protein
VGTGEREKHSLSVRQTDPDFLAHSLCGWKRVLPAFCSDSPVPIRFPVKGEIQKAWKITQVRNSALRGHGLNKGKSLKVLYPS